MASSFQVKGCLQTLGLRATPAVYSPFPSQFLILEDGDGGHTAYQLFSIRSFKVNPPQGFIRTSAAFTV